MEEKKKGRGRPRKSDKKLEEKKSKFDEISKNRDKITAKAEARAKKKSEEIIEKNNRLKAEIKNNDDTINTDDLKSEVSDAAEQEQSNLVGDQSIQSTDNDFNIDIPEDIDIPSEVQEFLSDDYIPDLNIPNDDFDPLKESVIKRKYTDGHLGKREDVHGGETGKNDDTASSNEDKPIEPLEPTIPEPEIKQSEPTMVQGEIPNQGGGQSQSQSQSQSQTQSTHKTQKPPINQDLGDLSPTQKRKAAEKTADALINTYANLVPVPFKYMSSFNIRKLEKRHMNDELDMYMQVMDDGTNVRDYCEKVNEEVDKIFVVTEEMQKEIKEPLIDVLLEQGFALTPSQRLLLAVGGQIVQMGITSIQLLQQNRSAIEQFKTFHKEKKESEEKQEQKRVDDATERSKNEEKKKHEEDVLSGEVISDNLTDITREDNDPTITVEEYLED